LTSSSKRWLYAFWLVLIAGFALLHALNLRADFPNHSPWLSDWAKYTDEGWYGNGAMRAHLFGDWYMPGDFNPAPAVPVWQFLEWILFFFTGVTIEAARGLAVAFFFVNLLLSYLLLRAQGPRWMALLALTFMVTSPFLYGFSRLAILEPLVTALTLAVLNLAVRVHRWRRPVWTSAGIGLLFTLMLLTKTYAFFFLPGLVWALVLPMWQNRKLALRCSLAAAGASFLTFAAWMALIVHAGLLGDFKYYFFVNKYIKPPEFYWPVLSFWWSFHGGLWIDHILVPLAGLVLVAALLALWKAADGSSSVGQSAWARSLLLDPVFGASVWIVAGCIFFMTVQNHPQPRYFALAAVFCFFMVAQGAGALLAPAGSDPGRRRLLQSRLLGWAVVALAALAVGINGAWTLNYAAHPEYTFVNAAQRLTRYIDQHPGGKRLLLSISGDELTLITHVPSLCDDFGTQELVTKLDVYQPGWFATWNDIDPGTLEDLHNHYLLEQVAAFRAFDDPERNTLVLFKLHPLPPRQFRDPTAENLQVPLPGDKIDIPVQ
jgi:4-amino-4-deoxy-L-arabinose transferase-like glycosyltransferase